MNEPVLRVCADPEDTTVQLAADVRRGLTSDPKFLPLRWHYDTKGEALFTRLGTQPDYYLTRSETEILTSYSDEIAAASGSRVFIELGAGLIDRVKLLLNAFSRAGQLDGYWAFDINESALESTLADLCDTYPGAKIGGISGDFLKQLDQIPDGDDRLVALLGSTFGNFTSAERGMLLQSLRTALHPGEKALFGVDLVKDPDVILRAYNDSGGVTGAFNLNVLRVLNRHLDANFDLRAFHHRARWNSLASAVEMCLVAEREMTVDISALEMDVHFDAGEVMQSGFSCKFRPDDLAAEVDGYGFTVTHRWFDAADYYGVFLMKAV
ncbi:L-histidine N(alpha)-methyltransferase [Haloglycomyces albus]|uniref:L-histidine N(alpha)-methyltransferase n=1 Tax=Haloglycomyces albus TaxID=526067 RepID=UPI00046D2204|nr:L-histidine N(alpha)-methyltransferase [Haloglycomyces albus]